MKLILGIGNFGALYDEKADLMYSRALPGFALLLLYLVCIKSKAAFLWEQEASFSRLSEIYIFGKMETDNEYCFA